MNTVFDKKTQKVPVKIWADLDQVEPQALQQLKNMAALPFVFKHVAAMPDVHFGIGATVGSVIATKNAVIPAAVGVDIGCGMAAVQLNGVKAEDLKLKSKALRHTIERAVPVGFAAHKRVEKDVLQWAGWQEWDRLTATHGLRKKESELKTTALHQMGSLGGGNHFIELCEDTNGGSWVMLHSGSRGIGNQMAQHHIRNAKEEMKRLLVSLPDPDLAYYVEGTDQYRNYMYDLMWAQQYAANNREVMLTRILKNIAHELGHHGDVTPLDCGPTINCHHNYATMENHYGENVLITRKGAVRSQKGDLGIIPGSMGTRSYIVRGLGNPESFSSCSHGAGRKMSRTQARKTFTIKDLTAQTEGVDCRKDAGVLDEIPGAYKDIDQVMDQQKDLVEVVAQLKQFLCVKG